jgi:hypothetical protein
MTMNFSEDWKKNRDRIAAAESFDDDYGSAYDRIVYDVPNKGNAAGITLPKRPTQMTVGELEDNFRTAKNPTEARLRSQQYGAKRFGPNSPQARYGSSGTGKYQFEVTTLSQTAREVFGPNYRDVVYSPENQEKLAEYLYNKSAKAGTLGTTWAAMRDGSGTTQPQNKPMVASNQAVKPAEPAEKSEYEQGMNLVSGLWNKAIEAGKYAQKNPGKIPPALKSQLSGQFSEETSKIRFKDLRNKIYEQIITNEEIEALDEAGGRLGALNTAIQLAKSLRKGGNAIDMDIQARQLKALQRKYSISDADIGAKPQPKPQPQPQPKPKSQEPIKNPQDYKPKTYQSFDDVKPSETKKKPGKATLWHETLPSFD